jgi:hypothetical protein
MSDPHATPDPEARDAYRLGVLALLEGRWDDARRELQGPAEAGMAPAILALAKVHLAREEAADARRRLAELLDPPPDDRGFHAYLLLLDAFAVALEGRTADALRALEAVMPLDARLEGAARTLRRRLEKRRPPLLRL